MKRIKTYLFHNSIDRIHRTAYWDRERDIMYHKMITVLVIGIILMGILKLI